MFYITIISLVQDENDSLDNNDTKNDFFFEFKVSFSLDAAILHDFALTKMTSVLWFFAVVAVIVLRIK